MSCICKGLFAFTLFLCGMCWTALSQIRSPWFTIPGVVGKMYARASTMSSGDTVFCVSVNSKDPAIPEGLRRYVDTSNERNILVMYGFANRMWGRSVSGSTRDYPPSIGVTTDDAIMLSVDSHPGTGDLAGMSKGDWDIYLFRLDKQDGKVVWKKVYGGRGTDAVFDILPLYGGGVLLTGTTNSNDGDFKGLNKGKKDVYVIKVDANGDVAWKRIIGGSSFESVHSCTILPDQGVLLCGSTWSNDGDFKGKNHGMSDMFAAKVDKNGKLVYVKAFGGKNNDEGVSIIITPTGYVMAYNVWDGKDAAFTVEEKFDIYGNHQK